MQRFIEIVGVKRDSDFSGGFRYSSKVNMGSFVAKLFNNFSSEFFCSCLCKLFEHFSGIQKPATISRSLFGRHRYIFLSESASKTSEELKRMTYNINLDNSVPIFLQFTIEESANESNIWTFFFSTTYSVFLTFSDDFSYLQNKLRLSIEICNYE